MGSKKKGLEGETKACGWFCSQGYEILQRNFKGPRGEVDIIVRKQSVLVFVEVKTFDCFGLDALEQAVDGRKQKRILDTAKYFLFKNPQYCDSGIRFDVLLQSGDREVPYHLENAFTEFGVS